MQTQTIESIVSDFVSNLHSAIEERTADQLRGVLGSIGGAEDIHRARRQAARTSMLTAAGRPRKKPPIQFCPVPRCRERAAPVFGMLCAKHKNTPKALVKKYRDARRARKAGVR